MVLSALLISYDPVHYVGGIGTFTMTLLKYCSVVNINIIALINKPLTNEVKPLKLPSNLLKENKIYYTEKGETYDEYLNKSLKIINKTKNNFDVIICNGILEVLLSIEAFQDKVPIVLILHDKIPQYMNKYFMKLKRFINKYKNIYLFVLSDYMKQYALNLGFDENKIFKITPGVDLKVFDPNNFSRDDTLRLRSKLNLDDSNKIVFCPARFDPEKGIDIFVKAIFNVKERLQSDDIKIKILFSGKYHAKELYINETRFVISKYKKYVLSLISKYNLWNDIIGGREFLQLPPFEYNELPLLHNLSTLTVLPSIDEPLGLAAIESIVMGTPVVATKVGGFVETIDNNILGVLVEPKDISSLSEAIYKLISESYKIYEKDAKLFNEIRKKYDAQRMVREIKNIFETITSL